MEGDFDKMPRKKAMRGRTPRVSIGLGVYNGEKFLVETLDSILNQTFDDFELVISDNASSDSTEGICRSYAARDPRIRYTRNAANIGLTNNFNRVLDLATGQYFRWASADDLFALRSLEACVKVLDEHPEVVLCYPRTVLIDGDGKFIRNYDDNMNLRSPVVTTRFQHVIENLRLVNIQYGLIRSDVLRRTSLFGAYVGSDMTLIAEIALYGQFWEIPEVLFSRRMHDGATLGLKNKPLGVQEEYWNGTTNRGLDLYYGIHRCHNLKSILRAPVSFSEKLRLACCIGKYVFRSRDVHGKELLHAGGQLLRRLRRTSRSSHREAAEVPSGRSPGGT